MLAAVVAVSAHITNSELVAPAKIVIITSRALGRGKMFWGQMPEATQRRAWDVETGA